MALGLPNASEPMSGSAPVPGPWYAFFARIVRSIEGPWELPAYTIAQLPSAAAEARVVFVSDASGGGVPVYSRGGVWRRIKDDTEVS